MYNNKYINRFTLYRNASRGKASSPVNGIFGKIIKAPVLPVESVSILGGEASCLMLKAISNLYFTNFDNNFLLEIEYLVK